MLGTGLNKSRRNINKVISDDDIINHSNKQSLNMKNFDGKTIYDNEIYGDRENGNENQLLYNQLFGIFIPISKVNDNNNEENGSFNNVPKNAKDVTILIKNIIDNWIVIYKNNNVRAIILLLNFILISSGCPGSLSFNDSIDINDLEANEHISNFQQMFDLDIGNEYPLIAKPMKPTEYWSLINDYKIQNANVIVPILPGTKFKKMFIEFWTQWIKILYSQDLLSDNDHMCLNIVITWLIQMSSSHFRPFRHTATLASLTIGTSLCDIANKLFKRWSTLNKQKETEKIKNSNSIKFNRLEKDISDLESIREPIEDMINDIQSMVFALRYHDRDAIIRQESLFELGQWIIKYPAVFMDNKYLRHFGWTLSDKIGFVRLTSLKALHNLYEIDSVLENIHEFTMRFKSRIIEMALSDRDSHVRMEATHILCEIFFSKGFLQDEDRNRLSILIFHTDAKIRELVSPLIIERINDNLSNLAEKHGFTELLEDESNSLLINKWYHNALSMTIIQLINEKDDIESTESSKVIDEINSFATVPESKIENINKSVYIKPVMDITENGLFKAWIGKDWTNKDDKKGSLLPSYSIIAVDSIIRVIYKKLSFKLDCNSILEFLADYALGNNSNQMILDSQSSNEESNIGDDTENVYEYNDDIENSSKRRRTSRRLSSVKQITKNKKSKLNKNNIDLISQNISLTDIEESCLVLILKAIIDIQIGNGEVVSKKDNINFDKFIHLPQLLLKYSSVINDVSKINILAIISGLAMIPLPVFFKQRMGDVLNQLRNLIIDKISQAYNSKDVLTACSSLFKLWTPKDKFELELKPDVKNEIFEGEINIFMEETADYINKSVMVRNDEIVELLSDINSTLVEPEENKQLSQGEYVVATNKLFDMLGLKLKRLERLFSRYPGIKPFNKDTIKMVANDISSKDKTKDSDYSIFLSLFDNIFKTINYGVNLLSDFEQDFMTLSGNVAKGQSELFDNILNARMNVQECIMHGIKLGCQLTIWELYSFANILNNNNDKESATGMIVDEDMDIESVNTVKYEIRDHVRQIEQLSRALFSSKEIRINSGLRLASISVFCAIRNLDIVESIDKNDHVPLSSLKSVASSIDLAIRYCVTNELTLMESGNIFDADVNMIKMGVFKVIVDFLRILTSNAGEENNGQSTIILEQTSELLWCICPYVNTEIPQLDHSGLFRIIKNMISKLDFSKHPDDAFNMFILNSFLVDFKMNLDEIESYNLDVPAVLNFEDSDSQIDSITDKELLLKISARKDFMFLFNGIGMNSKDRLAIVFRFLRWWFFSRYSEVTKKNLSASCLLSKNVSKVNPKNKSEKDKEDPDFLDDDEYNDVAYDYKENLSKSQLSFNNWMITILLRHKLADKMFSSLEKLYLDQKLLFQKEKSINKLSEDSNHVSQLKIDLLECFLKDLKLALGK